jgi:hypothetical protein
MALLRCRRRFASGEADHEVSIQERRHRCGATGRNTPEGADNDQDAPAHAFGSSSDAGTY